MAKHPYKKSNINKMFSIVEWSELTNTEDFSYYHKVIDFPTQLQVLKSAKEYIKRGWCQKAYACDKFDNPIEIFIDNPIVCKWCVIGAIQQVCKMTNGYECTIYNLCIKYIIKVIRTNDILGWNDTIGRTQSEVLELFDKAMQLALNNAKLNNWLRIYHQRGRTTGNNTMWTTGKMIEEMIATFDEVIVKWEDGIYTATTGTYKGTGDSVDSAIYRLFSKFQQSLIG